MKPKRFIALDIETTGVQTGHDQILEVAAIAFDPAHEERDEFSVVVRHRWLRGDPVAISMNAELIKEAIEVGIPEDDARSRFRKWLEPYRNAKMYPVGFNVGKFDYVFLSDQGWLDDYRPDLVPPHLDDRTALHYRTVELGTLFISPEGIPGASKEVIPRELGEGRVVAHRALQDARDAEELFRIWWRRYRSRRDSEIIAEAEIHD